MANETQNYHLTKPLESEFYDIEVQNENMDKIDQALKDHADGIKELQDGQSMKADLDDSGKVPAEQLPAMNYELAGTAESEVSAHNENEAAHPFLMGQIEACITAAQNAQIAADSALEAASKIAFTIYAVPSQNGTLTYTGSAQTPFWNSFNPNAMTIGGVISGTNAGTYTATFTPKEEYQWADGTNDPKSVTWKINRASIAVPVQSGTLTYTGSEQTPSWSGYNSSEMTLSGTVNGTNAGSYNATFTPGANYQWTDGTAESKTVQWNISKAAGSLTLGITSVALNVSDTTRRITVTKIGDGVVTATSSNTSVATVSMSGDAFVVAAWNSGSATITVKVGEGTNHTAPANKTCSVTVTFPQTTLNNNSWTTIKQASSVNAGANYWAVGDTKTITINGTVQGFNFSNFSVNAFILGFNHNSSREGDYRIHFQIGKTVDGKDIAFCDSKYNSTGTDDGFRMNKSNVNAGGWGASYGRKQLLGNDGTPTSPVSGSFMAALPLALRQNMKSVTKYTDNAGGDSSSASDMNSTLDYLFLLSEFEIQGNTTFANPWELNVQKQYDYYKAGNSKTKYRHDNTSSIIYHQCRSAHYRNGTDFCFVNTGGGSSVDLASIGCGLAPGFCV